jgi:hypothetical protein
MWNLEAMRSLNIYSCLSTTEFGWWNTPWLDSNLELAHNNLDLFEQNLFASR